MNTEKNILLAEFMGFQKTNIGWFDYEECFSEIEVDNTFDTEDLCFHSNWNWIMKVVEKIEDFRFSDSPNTMRFDVKMKHHSCHINDHEIEGAKFIYMGGFHSKIEAVYSACVEFVEWFNKQEK